MSTRVVCFLIVLVLASSPSALGQKGDRPDGVILLNPNLQFILEEPVGWTLDTQTAHTEGLEAVLYRKGSSWKDAAAVMYARVIQKNAEDTVEEVISNDIADFMKLSKESTVAESPSIQTRDKKQALIRVFYDAANKNYESVAFIDNDRVVVVIALSSRTKDEYEKALLTFRDVVASFFAFKLTVQPSKPENLF